MPAEIDESKRGVYCIRNILNGKRYIGSTGVSFRRRWRSQRQSLRRNEHRNKHLNRAWEQCGESSFVFEVLEYIDDVNCLLAEAKWMNHYKSSDQSYGYNTMPVPGSAQNYKHSEETKARMSIQRRGRPGHPMPEDHKARLNALRIGKPRSIETRTKISAALIGRKLPSETRAKMSEARTGLKRTDESKQRMSNAQRGKRHTPEARAKMSAAKAGKQQSVESIANRLRGKAMAKCRRASSLLIVLNA